jgi:hypothetical protein
VSGEANFTEHTSSQQLPPLSFMSDVVNSSVRKQKVVLLRELQRAIIYKTKMSKQVTKSHVKDTVHMYLMN